MVISNYHAHLTPINTIRGYICQFGFTRRTSNEIADVNPYNTNT